MTPAQDIQASAGDEAAVPPARGKSLVLLGNETVTLDQGTHIYDRICVQDDARINVRGPVTLVLATNQTTVIGGRGIGPIGPDRGAIRVETQVAPEIFVLCDNQDAPVDLELDAQKSKVSVGITGKAGLNITGRTFTTHSFAGWGLPAQWPTCDLQMDRELEPSFPPSIHIPQNCVGRYGASNYTKTPPPNQTEELHVVGVYEGRKHVNGTVAVHVNDASKPVVLALSAYQPTHWNIITGPQVRLKAVYVWGFKPGTQTVTGISQNVQIHEDKFVACTYGWEPAANKGGCSYKALIRAIHKTTGLVETSFQGCYAGNVFEVPYEQ